MFLCGNFEPVSKVLFTTLGSHGDLHPYIAMALAFKKRGDSVCIASSPQYRENVERLGIRFIPMGPSLEELGPEANWVKQASDLKNGAEFIITKLVLPYLEQCYQHIEQEVRESDLVITHILSLAAPMAAEKYNIPWLSCSLQPSVFLSAYDPPSIGPALHIRRLRFLGPGFLRFCFKLGLTLSNKWFFPLVKFRKKLGLPPTKKNPFADGSSPYANLVLFPEIFAHAQPDWPTPYVQTDFPIFDQDGSADLSSAVKDFLSAGPAPLVFTLGTAIVKLESDFYKLAYKVIKRLGVRAIFLVSKNPLGVPPEAYADPLVLVSAYEPFSLLFPRCSLVVHQCGIGTTAQALRAARPQVLVPFAHDQPDNARRVVELGIGEQVLASRLTERRLYRALSLVLADPAYAESARRFAQELASLEPFEVTLMRAASDLAGI